MLPSYNMVPNWWQNNLNLNSTFFRKILIADVQTNTDMTTVQTLSANDDHALRWNGPEQVTLGTLSIVSTSSVAKVTKELWGSMYKWC